MSRSSHFDRFLLTLLLASFVGLAHGFCTAAAPDTSFVFEYYDARTDRYFMSWDAYLAPNSCGFQFVSEIAPAGSTSTGLAFRTQTFQVSCAAGDAREICRVRWEGLCRFRAAGQAEPASQFFTINQAECEALKQPLSGWIFEPMAGVSPGGTYAPLAAAEIDPATGRCSAGTLPVYRFYNNRWREGLSNHRFVADESVRKQMQSRPGWFEEGIAFCVSESLRPEIATVEQYFFWDGAFPSCASTPYRYTSVDGYNVVVPGIQRGPYPVNGTQAVQPLDYYDRTGAITPCIFTNGRSRDADEAARTFYQIGEYFHPPGGGFHLTSADRTAGSLAALGARTRVIRPGFLPFLASYEVDMDLLVTYRLFVKRTRAGGVGSDAAARPLIALRDSVSGRRFYLSPGAIGTFPVIDSTARDPAMGEIVASIALLPQPSVGRNLGLPSLQIPANFDSLNAWGYGGDFEYRINRKEFARVLERVRALDPQLDANPDNYSVESITMQGEVAGTADIGFNVQQFSATVVRP